MRDVYIKPGLTIPAHAISWTAVRSAGPGGQNVNRVATKVDLRFDPDACPQLPPDVRRRLCANARLDAQGRVLIVSQATRSRDRNLEDARDKLVALVRAACVRPRPRRATKPTRGSVERRLLAKRGRAAVKAGRSRRSVED